MNDLVRRLAAVGLKGTAAFHPTNHCRAISSSSSLFGGHPCEKPALRFSTSPTLSALHQPREVQRLFSTSLNAEDHATNSIVTDGESGKQYGVLLDTRKLPKLKPGIVQKRLANCKKYIGNEKSIRQSPWKLNRVCQLAAGLALEEALTQLQYCDIKNADLVAKVLKRTSNLADIRDGLQMSQLEVAECFTTKSMMLKRVKPMGRGRYVDVRRMLSKKSHFHEILTKTESS